MLSEKIQKQLIEAMKAKDSLRVSTFRMLNSELKNAKIDKGSELTEEEELKVVKKEAKKRKDAIEAYEKGGDDEKASKEKEELKILEQFLPDEMSDQDLEKLVRNAIKESGATTAAEFGKVMPIAMQKAAGQADGKRVAEMVRKKLD